MGPDGREVQLSSSDQKNQKVSGPKPVQKPVRKWRKRLVWVGLISPLGIVAGVLIVGQTSLMKIIVEPILEDQLGVDVTTGSIRLMPTGEIVIQDAVCKADTIDNRAGSLIQMEQATIWVNWLGVINGRNQVKSIQIVRPTVRVSQDVESGVLNLAALKFKKGSGGGVTPAMEIKNGILEIGEHDQSGYRLLKELSIQGRLSEQTDSGVSGFEFVALPVEASISSLIQPVRGTIGLTGQISSDGIDGVLDGVHLQDWPAEIVPSRSRGVYQQLDLAGELAPTRFHVSNDGLIEIVLMLDGVSLNLPIPETQSPSGPTIEPMDSLRMRETKGVIRFGTMGLNAELDGLIDDLQYNVQLEYLGLDTTSAFNATLVTSFRLDGQFKPMKFLPAGVMTKLDRFESPIADVQARVFATRSADSGEQEIKVSGIAQLSNGSAIYKKFRYPFHDLAGTIEFDPDKLVIQNITGIGPGGASLVANGLFSPLGEESVVELGLQVEGVGIDDHLIQAMDQDQRELVGALFNKEQYANLLKEELVLTRAGVQELGDLRRRLWDRLDQWVEGRDGTGEDRMRVAQQLAEVDRRLLTPVFDFGGSANIDVMLRRYPERPSDDRWTTDVRVKLPSAGLVSKHFPLPIVASDVEITVSQDRVELTGGHYSGLQGGHATVDVAIDLTQSNAKPVIQIDADEFPIDERLIAAIPGYHDQQSDDPDDISLRRILDRLRLEGVVECDAIIGPRSNGQLGYDVESTILRGSARPALLTHNGRGLMDSGLSSEMSTQQPGSDHVRSPSVGSDPIAFDDLLGTVYITEELIIVDMNGMLSSPDQPLAPTPIEVLTQLTMPTKRRGMGGVRRVDGLLPTDFGPPTPGPTLFASAYADGLDLAMPLEHAIAVVSPRVARDLLETTDPYSPNGVIGLHAQLEGIVGGSITTDLVIDRVEQFEFDLDQTQYQIGSSWGSATVSLGDSIALSFDEFRVPIEADGISAGEISLDGSLPFVRGGEYREVVEAPTLAIVYKDGRFESPVTQHIIERFSSDTTSGKPSWFDAQSIGGRFHLDVKLTPELGLHWVAGDSDSIKVLPTRIDGSLKPESLSLEMDDRQADFDDVSGTIQFQGFEGVIREVRATSESASIGLDGRWSMYPQQGFGVDVTIDARGDLLTGSVRAILPDTIDRVIDRLEIQSNAPVDIQGLRIIASHLGRADANFDIAGGAKLIDGNAMIGLPITGLTGDLQFHVHGEENRVGYEIGLDAARLRAGLMRVHDAHISIIGDANNPGVILVPEIIAGMHGGQIAGSAQIRPGLDGTPHYWIELHASGVRAAPMFDDLLLPPEGLEGPPRPGRMTVLSAWSLGEDLSRGSMIGDLTLTGPTDDPSKRSGRGLARISGGSVVTLPGLINLIEASNLSLPSGAPLDLAEAAFYVDGRTLAFEQLSMSSKRVEILGYGTLDWVSRDLDLRFSSRAVNQIPVVSGIVEKLRDELISTRVTGKMNNPQYSVQQFGSIKRLIDAMLGVELSDQQQRLREVEKQVLQNKIHSQRGAEEIIHQPTQSYDESWQWEVEDEIASPNNPNNPSDPSSEDE